MRNLHIYTTDQHAWLKEHRPQLMIGELTRQFNAKFGTELSRDAIKGTCKRLGIATGRTGQFEPGQTPHNAGCRGLHLSPATEFKKGNRPANAHPVGTELMKSIDYVAVKIAEPNVWKYKHIMVWEEHNGPVPKGHVVIFKDGNRLNFYPDNLACVTRQELLQMSRNKYLKQPADIKPVVMTLSKLQVAIFAKANAN